MTLHYDREGRQVSLGVWAQLMEDPGYRRVAETTIGNWWVSTVWLGIDAGYGFQHSYTTPFIFETMVFDRSARAGEPHRSVYQQRYAMEEEALVGHDATVAMVDGWGLEESTGWE